MASSMFTRAALCGGLALALVLAIGPASARAQADGADAEARALFQRGDTAYTEGRYESALALFEEAYALSQRPALLYNIANALERLGRTADAVTRLEEFEAHASPEQQAVVARRIESLRARQAAHEFEESERDREAREALEAEIGARYATPMVTPTPWGGIAMYIGAAITAGLGVALGVSGQSTASAAVARCQSTTAMGTICPSGAAHDLDLGRGLALGADISFGATALLVVVGTVWLIVDVTSPVPATQPSAQLQLMPTGAALSVHF